MTAIPYPSAKNYVLVQALRAILITGVLLVLGLGITLFAFEASYSGRIYPGVSVAGADLSGLTPAEAAGRITQQISYPERGRVLLYDNAQSWSVSPAQLGFFLDPETSALKAMQAGRSGNLLQRMLAQYDFWLAGTNLSPVFVFDQRVAQRYLLELAQQLDRPVVEASMGLTGVDVQVRSGQVGRALDTQAGLALLSTQLISLRDGAIRLPIRETPPVVLDVTAQAELAKKILSAPLILSITDPAQDDPGPWTFDPQVLASMLAVERVEDGSGAKYQVALNTDTLRVFLTNLAPKLERPSQMPLFTFNETTKQIDLLQKAILGRSLDVDGTIRSINEKLTQGEHNVPLVFTINPPAVTDDATAEQLGIKELIREETSYFYGSGAPRVQNITTATRRFNGVLVAPGEVFSMAKTLGDISLDNGYAEAPIIYGNQTIQGVGGGVCQVSTTLFRAAFFAGFPIVERNPHAYRVLYYEKVLGNKINTNLAGLDATVFVPLVDFRFKNDTPYWLLMETAVDPAAASITWRFYSTSDGRKVDWKTTGLTNVTPPPPPVYRENPSLAKGEIKQVDWKVAGADVTVNRTVYKDGQVYLEDTFFTRFQAWRDVFEYGPGTENIPTPEPTP